jgi:hypothetical protein
MDQPQSTTTPESLALRLLVMVNSNWITQALYVATELGLPDLLASGPQSSASRAQATGAHAPSLHRLLRALVTIEIVREREDGDFALLPMGALLRSDAATSLRSWAILVGRIQWQAWGHLLDSVKTGESALKLLADTERSRHLAQNPAAVLHQLLVKRGNPFFLEETVRTLVETKALAGSRGRYRLTQPLQALRVPPTVQSILAARIDRLSPEDKRLLQTASMVGKDVPFALLHAIAELPDEALRGSLDRLRAAEFLYETGLFPDLAYTFKHVLTHEVTYGGLLQERRRELHARIVDAIETLQRERLGEQIDRLAHHASRGELREKAVHYLRQAGLKAAARSVLQDARGWFEQALGVLEALPESQAILEQAFEIRLELRPVLVQLGEVRRSLDRVREAESLAERLNDAPRRGRACAFMTITHSMLGELDEALVTGTRALGIAGRFGDLRLRILTTSYLHMTHYHRGVMCQHFSGHSIALRLGKFIALLREIEQDRHK